MSLLLNKNHDYDEAWKEMRISSMTDIILMKLYRTKQIESNGGETLISHLLSRNCFQLDKILLILKSNNLIYLRIPISIEPQKNF